MKRFAFLVAANLLGGIYLLPHTGAEANGQLDRVLANMQQAAKGVRTLQANLAFRKRYDIGGKPEENWGIIKFRHASPNHDQVRIQYNNGVVVVVDSAWIRLYQPQISQITKTPRNALAKQNKELSFLETPYQSISQLRARYEIAYQRDESLNSRQTSVIELTPKSQSTTKKLTLWVDQSSWLPVQYQIAERASVTTFTLSDIRLNGDLGRDPFKIDVPSGTKEVIPK